MTPEREELLARYAAHGLSEEEERELLRAALKDQELFEALAHEHAMREVMDNEECRRVAVVAAEEPRRHWLAAFLGKPLTLGLAGACATAAIIGVIVLQHPGAPVIEPTANQAAAGAGRPGELADTVKARIAELMGRAPDAGLSIRFPVTDTFPMNGQLDVRISSSRNAALLAVEIAPGARARLLFPYPPDSAAGVAAGQEVKPPAEAARIEGLPGKREIWLLAFPPDTPVAQCLTGSAPWPEPRAARKATFMVNPQ
jgi:hypothetical protein